MMYMPESVTPVQPDQANQVERTTVSSRTPVEQHRPAPVAVELSCAPASVVSPTKGPYDGLCPVRVDDTSRSTREPHHTTAAVELSCAPAADLSTRSTTEPHQPSAVELLCAPAADLSTRSTTEPRQPPAVELSCAPATSRYTTKGPYDGICPVRVDDSSTEPRYAPVPADLCIRMVAPPFIKHPYDFFKDRKYVIDLSDDDNDISDCEENNDHEVMDALTARTRWRNEQNMMADIYKDRLVEWWDAKMKAKPTVDMEKTKYRNRNREYMSPLSVVRNYLAGEDRKAAERSARLSTTTAVPLPTTTAERLPTTTAERLPTTGTASQLRPSTALMPELAQNGVQSNRPNYPPNVDMMSKKPKLAQNGVQSNRPKCPPTDLLSEMLKMAQNGVLSNGSKCPPTDLLSEMLKLAQNGVQSNRPNYPPNVDMMSKKPKLAQNGVQSNRSNYAPNIDMMSKKPKLPQNGLSSTNKPNCPTKTDLAQKDDYDKMLELVDQQSRGNSGPEVMKPVTAAVQGSSSVSAILQKRKRDDTAPDDMPRPLKYAKSSQPDPTPSVRPKALVRPSEPSRPSQSTKSSARDKIKCAWNIAAILGSGDSRDHVSKSKKQKRM